MNFNLNGLRKFRKLSFLVKSIIRSKIVSDLVVIVTGDNDDDILVEA